VTWAFFALPFAPCTHAGVFIRCSLPLLRVPFWVLPVPRQHGAYPCAILSLRCGTLCTRRGGDYWCQNCLCARTAVCALLRRSAYLLPGNRQRSSVERRRFTGAAANAATCQRRCATRFAAVTLPSTERGLAHAAAPLPPLRMGRGRCRHWHSGPGARISRGFGTAPYRAAPLRCAHAQVRTRGCYSVRLDAHSTFSQISLPRSPFWVTWPQRGKTFCRAAPGFIIVLQPDFRILLTDDNADVGCSPSFVRRTNGTCCMVPLASLSPLV